MGELNKLKKSIIIDEELPTAFDRRGHRNIYYTKMNSIMNNKVAIGLNSHDVIRFLCNLQNWSMYTNYEESNFFHAFIDSEKLLYERLNEVLNGVPVRQKLYEGLKSCLKVINSVGDVGRRTYHSDLLEDLRMLTGLQYENKFYNFIQPNIYSDEAWAWTVKFFTDLGVGGLVEGK